MGWECTGTLVKLGDVVRLSFRKTPAKDEIAGGDSWIEVRENGGRSCWKA